MISSKRFDILRTILSVLIALAISFGIIFLVSEEPVNAITNLLIGPLKSKRSLGNVVESMIPLIFTGTGVCIMFSANQINLAGEGAFHVGGLFATCIAIKLAAPFISPVTALLCAGLAGAVFTAIPAIMKITTTASELVSSLMINYIALYFGNYMLNNVIGDPDASAASYKLLEVSKLVKIVPGTRIHFGLIIAIGVAVLGYWFLYRTKAGYELRLTGENEEFARYSGINIVKVIIVSQLLGGFVAGLGGGVEMLSPIYSRFTWTSLMGYGWDAIIICTLSKKNPLYTPFAALFLAYLRTGASIMARRTDVTLEIVQITQGIIILLVVAEQFLSKYKHKIIAKEAKAALKDEEVA
ncbi:MAG TPA: ABC transporter permease [Candidatus Blautia avistercoris]|uniref:ABC transporter permease n=1 Tax=Blautia sp. An249 TaxID=1965603 RepID=UPI000B3A2528|nr:ABC transporter permease [Blautia sp. An249]OUO79319.1 ABC transporter permease [Blautia sp. An249]HIY18004.1 ABC transporter permease [Candidatus Blautia avistercoris]